MATTIEINNLIDTLLKREDVKSDLANKVKQVYSSLLVNIEKSAASLEIKARPIDLNRLILPTEIEQKSNRAAFNKIQQGLLKNLQRAVNKMAPEDLPFNASSLKIHELLGESPEATYRTNKKFQLLKRDLLQKISALISSPAFSLNIKNRISIAELLGDAPDNSFRVNRDFRQLKRLLIDKIKTSVQSIKFAPEVTGQVSIMDLLGDTPESSRLVRRAFQETRKDLLLKIRAAIAGVDPKDILKKNKISIESLLGESPENTRYTNRRFQQIKRDLLEKISEQFDDPNVMFLSGKISIKDLLGETPENSFKTSKLFQQIKRDLLKKISQEINDFDLLIKTKPISFDSIINDLTAVTPDNKAALQKIKQNTISKVGQVISNKDIEITDNAISLKSFLGIADDTVQKKKMRAIKESVLSKIRKQINELDNLIPENFTLGDFFNETSSQRKTFQDRFKATKNKIIQLLNKELKNLQLEIIKPIEIDPAEIQAPILEALNELRSSSAAEEKMIELLEKIYSDNPYKKQTDSTEEKVLQLLEKIHTNNSYKEVSNILHQTKNMNDNLDFMAEQIVDLKDIIKTNELKETKKTKGLRIFEEDPTPVYLVKIHDDIWDKLKRIFGGAESDRLQSNLGKLGEIGALGTILGLGAGGALMLSDWITKQDWPGVWKGMFRYFLDPDYRMFFNQVLDENWNKFTKWFGEKWAGFTDAIASRWSKSIDAVKDSKTFLFVEEQFSMMAKKIEDFKLAFKDSKLGLTITKFTSKMTEMFDGIKSLFTTSPIDDAAKAADVVTGTVKGGGIAARISMISEYIKKSPLGKFVELLATGATTGGIGAKLATGAFKMLPIFGDILSILVGYNRITQEGGIMGWGQGVIDIVSGIIGLVGGPAGAPISVALDAVNLVIDLARWGAEAAGEASANAQVQGYSGLWDKWASQLADFNKEFVLGIWSMLPEGARDFWEYDPSTGWLKYREGALMEKWDQMTDLPGLKQYKQGVEAITTAILSPSEADFRAEQIDLYKRANEKHRETLATLNLELEDLLSQGPTVRSAEVSDHIQRLERLMEENEKKISKLTVNDAQGWVNPGTLVGFYDNQKVVTGSRDFMTLAKEGGPIEKKLTELVLTVNENMNNLMDKIAESIEAGISNMQPAIVPIPPPVVNVPVNLSPSDLDPINMASYSKNKIYNQRAGFYKSYGG